MKQLMTPETAIQTFMNCQKEGKQIPETVMESLHNYRNWGENQLIGLLNASAYFPDLLFEAGMEDTIQTLLKKFQDRIVPSRIF